MNDVIQYITDDIQHRIDRVIECANRELMERLPSKRVRLDTSEGYCKGVSTVTDAFTRIEGDKVVLYIHAVPLESEPLYGLDDYVVRADRVEFIIEDMV